MIAGRDCELEDLRRRLDSKRPQFIRVFGRRRVGKTALLRELLSNRPGLYFNVDEAEPRVVLDALAAQLAAQIHREPRSYRDWTEFLEDARRTGAPLIVFDEFQNLLRAGQGVESRFQHVWDWTWQHEGPSLIVSGSSIGVMRRLTSRKGAPLFGRLTADLHLRPLPYAEARRLLEGLPEHERMRRFAIFGGTPHYLRFAAGGTVRQSLQAAFLSAAAPLLNEPSELLRTELRDSARYASVLHAIGHGASRLEEIESKAGLARGGASYYLGVLQNNMDLVSYEAPVLGRGRFGRYVVDDPFFSFYYRFVSDLRNLVEQHREKEMLALVERDLEAHVGRIFEQVVRETLTRAPTVAGMSTSFVRRAGGWWNRVGEEIDLVLAGEGEVWAGEVKWSDRPEGPSLIHRLREKLRNVEKLGSARVRPFVVCRGGVTREAKDLLSSLGGFSLDLADLVHLLEAPTPPSRLSGCARRLRPGTGA